MCDLGTVAEKYNTVVVHKIFENFVPGGNSPLETHIDFETKLKIVMGLRPNVAASFVTQGVRQKLFGGEGVGVIFSGAEIAHAGIGDAGSKPTGLNSREGAFQEGILVSDEIKQTVDGLVAGGDKYSEVFVKRPEVAGLFYSGAPEGINNEEALKHGAWFKEVAKKYNLPLYILAGGVFTNSETGQSVSSVEITSQGHGLPEEDRTRIVGEVLESGAFKTKSPEKGYVAEWSKGRQSYLELGSKRVREYLALGSGKVEMFNLRTPVSYELRSGHLVKRISERVNKEIATKESIVDFDLNANDHLRPGDFGAMQLSTIYLKLNENHEPITEPLVLIELIQKWIADNQDRLSGEPKQKEIASFLFGFSEQAELVGDAVVAQAAKEVGDKLFSHEEFSEIRKKRIGPDGRFRCTQEDIDNIGK